ncbi:MAG TPA: chemotaxis response regulator protein-glutamate methylesterase [Candidatus Mailhella excrementigallinarum]|nr:MAG: chemotaxis response regulator protein-glutamate methylesterase [Desulfovibrionaceae bacterium]HIV66616.1 chemotaxis response regulator protein-glutamate methylesterase [Candidatus Mailhella excrementigallinarum]
MIKVLIVDDSAFMRSALTRMLEEDPEIKVIGQAGDGEEGLRKVEELNPDLVTLDLEMPRLDGIGMLERLMKTNPKPVLIVSSLSVEGAEPTLRALEAGALDFIPKYQEGGYSLDFLRRELHGKIKAVARRGRFMRPLASPRVESRSRVEVPAASGFRPRPSFSLSRNAVSSPSGVREQFRFPAHSLGGASPMEHVLPSAARVGRPKRDIVAIGVSTGGPPAVQKVLSALPADFPACILIAQHMPATFTEAFARRLDNVCKIHVSEARGGDKIGPGLAYVCPGGRHLRLDMHGPLPFIDVVSEPADALYKPSVNVLMESAGNSMGRRVVGVTMTGMGSDGVEGSRILKEKGGYLIAQNEASCVVYGMPKAVVDAGLADEVVGVDSLAASIQDALYR